jgi:hypothetical protein
MQEGGGIVDTIVLWGGVALAWAAGESGRVVVASGMGGLMRWLTSEQRRIRDGVIAVIGGAIAGTYFWPAVLVALSLEKTPENIALSAFVAGTIGMSIVKIATAVVEARIKSWAGGE